LNRVYRGSPPTLPELPKVGHEIICGACGQTLAQSDLMMKPSEKILDRKCRHCGIELSLEGFDVEITPRVENVGSELELREERRRRGQPPPR